MNPGPFATPLPSELSPSQRRLYDVIVTGPRSQASAEVAVVDEAGRLRGPLGPMLHAPELGEPLQAVGLVIRQGMGIDPAVAEVATLWCAQRVGSHFEVEAHTALARKVGVPEETIVGVLGGVLPSHWPPADLAFVRAAGREQWDPESLAESRAWLDPEHLAKAVILGGYYRLLAALDAAFGEAGHTVPDAPLPS